MPKIDIVAALTKAIGADRVQSDEKLRAHFSRDLFWSGEPPICVVSPKTAEEVAAVVGVCTEAGHPVVPRGGGISYTGGYVANDPSAVMLDLRGLNRIRVIDTENRFVVVEAGCTWAQLHEALIDTGLRTPFWGPLSGLKATVGGALSQNSVFFGSVQYGAAGDSLLGLDVVLADGSILKTGSGARTNGLPFTRWGGADITGLFVGDTGAFGVKVAASLKLIPQPPSVDFGSYAFPDIESMLRAQVDLVRAGLGAETFGIDAYKAKNSAQTGRKLSEASKTAMGVLKNSKNFLSGLKDVAGMALSGTSDLENAPYSLHLTVEGDDDEHTSRQLKRVLAIVQRHGGAALPVVVPKAMRGRPFPPLAALGGDGQRWVPVHGLLPLARAVDATLAVERAIGARQAEMDKFGVLYSPLTTNIPNGVLFEPCFYWYDEVNSLHAEIIETELPAEWLNRPKRDDVRKFVFDLWNETAAIMASYGAVNFQIGRAYPYQENLPESYNKILHAIKQHLDPRGLINPGVQGL